MKPGFSFIICIIDRSGSMQSIRTDAIGGFNTFLEEQKKHPEGALLTLVLFNDQYEVVHNAISLADVPPLTDSTYVPAGMTALLDAVGSTIDDVGKRLAGTREEERPEKVIVAILTDGEENSSKRYSYEQIATMITHQQEVYKWEFIFLAANQDAVSTAKAIAIHSSDAFQFMATNEGITHAYKNLSSEVTMRRKPRGDA